MTGADCNSKPVKGYFIFMTILLDDLEFNVVLEKATMRPLLEIIFQPDDDGNKDSRFIDLEKLQAAIKFLETEIDNG